MKLDGLFVGVICIVLLSVGIALNWPILGQYHARENSINFNRDIRPILNKNCTACHGGVKQAGDVSFIYREQVLGKGKSGRPTVIPGNPKASELIARVTSHDPGYRMPLNEPPLHPEQIALLKRWIKEGAAWEDYWAFVPPKPQTLPTVQQQEWVRQPLDHFILARLEEESLSPSPQASKTALLRRVSFDLTGLPPTPEELSSFLADPSKDAYEKQVDRLLASPGYGERWASMWLDLARYADSKGLVTDLERPGVWLYRDWVIDAFNENIPYNEFVIKQLAGDLLPEATLDDMIATSFHRQTLANDEGGTDNEEFRVAAIMDRVATTWSVLNGLTMNCVQCHSHPYDPIRYTDYYRSLAFFNTSRDADLAWFSSILEPDDDWPVVHIPVDPKLNTEAWQAQKEIANLRSKITMASRDLANDETQWTPIAIKNAKIDEMLGIERGMTKLQAYHAATPVEEGTRSWIYTNQIGILEERRAQLESAQLDPATFQIQNNIAQTPEKTPPYAVFELTVSTDMPLITALLIEAPTADPEKALHTPERGFIVDKIDAWIVQSDGSSDKIAFQFFAPDSENNLESSMTQLVRNKNVNNPETLVQSDVMKRLARNSIFAAHPNHFRKRWIAAVPAEPLRLAPDAAIKIQLTNLAAPLNTAPAQIPRVRVKASDKPRWTEFANSTELEENIARLEKLERRIKEIDTVPVPVMKEQPAYAQRATLQFDRGNFLSKTGPSISPGVPELFTQHTDEAQPDDRLALAQWFFSPQQPLTARIAVNRYWEQLFGAGIVETLEDIGSIGEEPSHPKLLDWLALHFQNDLQWDMKALLREMVTSATYRQSATMTPSLRDKDPRNRLLARGPHQRLTAEMVRDQALLASGLLTNKLGGPPVMPPQPEGLWSGRANFGGASWIEDTGPDRYRRALYTFIKRTTVYPSFLTFDASDHQVSLARRIPTNTPLQALVTLNDPVYREAAEALATRVREQVPGNNEQDVLGDRLNHGAYRVLSRELTTQELRILRQLYNDLINENDGTPDDALTEAASALLNLDAALTR